MQEPVQPATAEFPHEVFHIVTPAVEEVDEHGAAGEDGGLSVGEAACVGLPGAAGDEGAVE